MSLYGCHVFKNFTHELGIDEDIVDLNFHECGYLFLGTKDQSKSFEKNQKILVQGGLTNLVGSTKTFEDEIIISLDRMNKIEEIDEKSRTITLQSGVIVEDAINAVNEKDLLLPLNFGAPKGEA